MSLCGSAAFRAERLRLSDAWFEGEATPLGGSGGIASKRKELASERHSHSARKAAEPHATASAEPQTEEPQPVERQTAEITVRHCPLTHAGT